MTNKLLIVLALLLGGLGAVLGDVGTQAPEPGGPGWQQGPQQGPQGGFRPGPPGFAPGAERGPGTWRRVPNPAASPSSNP